LSITAFGMPGPDALSPLACTAILTALAANGGNRLDLRVLPLGLHLVEELDREQTEEAGQRSDGPRLRVGPGAELLHGACGEGHTGGVADAWRRLPESSSSVFLAWSGWV
jgi:hypothetical protein